MTLEAYGWHKTIKFCATALAAWVSVINFAVPLAAQSMPPELVGVWGPPGRFGAAGCKETDFGEDNGIVIVRRRKIIAHESDCTILKHHRIHPLLIEITMQCSGEGEKWNKVERWQFRRERPERILIDGTHLVSRDCLGTAATGDNSQWLTGETIQSTKWVYSERREGNVLVQCQTILKVDESYKITLAALSNESLVIVVADQNWVFRIRADHGWREGQHFENVQLITTGGTVIGTAQILPDLEFLITIPKGQPPFADIFFKSDQLAALVGGLTMKNWGVSGLAEAWSRLRKCPLVKRL